MVIEAGWIWAILAVVFLLIEVMTISFFFLLWAFVAAGVSLITFFIPLNWQWQLCTFIVLSLPCFMLWTKLTKHWRTQKDDPAAQLNQRSLQYVGREFELQTPVVHGVGKLQIGDTLWKIEGENLPAGSTIIITAASDNVLSFRHAK